MMYIGAKTNRGSIREQSVFQAFHFLKQLLPWARALIASPCYLKTMLKGGGRLISKGIISSPTFLRFYSSVPGHLPKSSTQTRSRSFHFTGSLALPKKRHFFSSNPNLQSASKERDVEEPAKRQKRQNTRSPVGKSSLRRVAVEAQRSRDGREKRSIGSEQQPGTKTVTAYCTAEQYNIGHVARILKDAGHQLDPYETGLYPQVVHLEIRIHPEYGNSEGSNRPTGDIFIFPSGTLVAWAVPEKVILSLVSRVLLPAAQYSHLDQLEEEDLEYVEDPERETSIIKGDIILLGTKSWKSRIPPLNLHTAPQQPEDQSRTIDTVLAKVAFSSGLARSTKLAVLETLLNNYFESTRSIPVRLSRGGRLPFTRSFILQKTGQLLSIRAQLNLYSELTDSLPDLFWDSRHELGLEGYYDQVGKVLDTNIRIKVLNEKMDYAQEIASVLRQQLSEQHGVRLEWIIIALITVEVGFAIRQEIKEYQERRASQEIQGSEGSK